MLTNPAVSKLRHDANNKLCALKLTTQLMERMTDPAKREALRVRAEEQRADWNAATAAYQAAIHDANRDMKRLSKWLKRELQKDAQVLKVVTLYLLVPAFFLVLAFGVVMSLLEDFNQRTLLIGFAICVILYVVSKAWDQWVALKREELELKRKEVDARDSHPEHRKSA